jgi:hypothetical protein
VRATVELYRWLNGVAMQKQREDSALAISNISEPGCG